MNWDGVPEGSSSSICGSFADEISGQILANSMTMIGDTSCSTDGSDMSTQVTINKQSCTSQASAIVAAMQLSLGDSGSLGDGTDCDFSGC